MTDFSTADGDDLRLNLSPGALEKNPDDYYVVADNRTYELPGKIDPDTAEQVFVFPFAGVPLETLRSFTVYNYATRTACGSAALE